MHISSLPSPYGIGTLGRAAYEFVDFLAAAKQAYWQVLPISPTGFGDSPYQSPCGFGGNPYFIDLDMLQKEGWLAEGELQLPRGEPDRVDYGRLYDTRYAVLRRACARLSEAPPADFFSFCEQEAGWLDDYALFMAFKTVYRANAWRDFPEPVRLRTPDALRAAEIAHEAEIRFWKLLQYLFYKQWRALKAYANERGVSIIGDLPIYAAPDSAEVWARPELFLLDANLAPEFTAGCPPDAFNPDGQHWGNPLFDWTAMRGEGYAWWIRRLHHAAALFDVTRIDHFRGFDSYYAIPAGRPDAKNGAWQAGPGMALFDAASRALGPLRIIAEDLGFLTDAVRRLVSESGYPGMRVLQFAFDGGGDNPYLPHNHDKNCVVYTGTHDNDTVAGWLETAPAEPAAYARAYLRLNQAEGEAWGFLKSVWASPGDLAIVQMQDILGLKSEARMNVPGTLGGNWAWRMTPGACTPALAETLGTLMALYKREGGE